MVETGITHGEVAEAARGWLHIPYARVALKEVGLPSGKRIDVLAYDPKSSTFRLVECKASLRDLKGVQKQLEKYRRYADLLYVAVPEDLETEARRLLPKNVGLLVVTRYGEIHPYLSTRCARNPRRVPISTVARKAMVRRFMTWLLTHYEDTRTCKNCMYTRPHGPS